MFKQLPLNGSLDLTFRVTPPVKWPYGIEDIYKAGLRKNGTTTSQCSAGPLATVYRSLPKAIHSSIFLSTAMTFLQKKTVVLSPTSESCPFTKKYLTMTGSVTLGRQSSTQASTASNGLFAIAGQSGSETDDLPVSPLHAELFIQNGSVCLSTDLRGVSADFRRSYG